MAYKRCLTCHGSGKVMGGGMMFNDCDECDGRGKIFDELVESNTKYQEVSPKIDKRSKLYRDAIKKIKALDPKMDDAKAAEIFETEYMRLDKDSSNASGLGIAE